MFEIYYVGTEPSTAIYSQRKLSTFQSGKYCLAVNETLLSAFRGHYCPDVCNLKEINVSFSIWDILYTFYGHKSVKSGRGGTNLSNGVSFYKDCSHISTLPHNHFEAAGKRKTKYISKSASTILNR